MHKLAVFVEGYTELDFVARLISEIAGAHRIVLDKRKICGGVNVPRRVSILETVDPGIDRDFYILLYDCGGEKFVKERIVEEHPHLTKNGYSAIIGLRDVRPNTQRQDISRLERNLKFGIKTALAPVDIILAVMEIEAWFLSESSHFSKIDPALDPHAIERALGFNPETQDMALRDTPTDDLIRAYGIAGKQYVKPGTATLDVLDYSKIYLELTARVPSLARLIGRVDSFLASPQAA